jgi:hypothetical protein
MIIYVYVIIFKQKIKQIQICNLLRKLYCFHKKIKNVIILTIYKETKVPQKKIKAIIKLKMKNLWEN